VPADDEGFTLRGDKRQLVYKGRKRSHRFTILGDDRFEYDCILNKEPESNTVMIRLEGAGGFDFFRQPDRLKNPLLAGSYAVYKKETLTGNGRMSEGTGKLCHIHRPEIIDARGRRVWGDLSVVGDTLCITIPEGWLSEARYPVIVDPVIGTSTVGSQYEWVQDEGEDPVSLMMEAAIPVNRFLVSQAINGVCTAFVYTNEDDPDAGGRPVLYSDNGNKPHIRKSMQEGFFDLRVTGGKPPGWRSAVFSGNEPVASGSYIWFGVFTDYIWFPRFDYGAKCYTDWWWDYGRETIIPDEYPLYNEKYYYDYKLSMYFEYTASQHYTRTLTQGVTLTDTRKRTGDFKRTLAIEASGSAFSGCAADYCRKNADGLTATDRAGHWGDYVRGLYVEAGSMAETRHKGAYYRFHQDHVSTQALSLRHVLIFIRLVTVGLVRDYLVPRFLRSKEEIVLKSPVTRELELESRIH
jgi:hypothetical protein